MFSFFVQSNYKVHHSTSFFYAGIIKFGIRTDNRYMFNRKKRIWVYTVKDRVHVFDRYEVIFSTKKTHTSNSNCRLCIQNYPAEI